MNAGSWNPEGWMTVPFIGLLLAIAVTPILKPHFWHQIRNQVLIVSLFSIPMGVLYFIKARSELSHSLEHYFSFVVLLGALFIVSGGILLRGDLKGTPGVNTLFLGVGAILSNLVGTTGASMILIRPLLRANNHRKNQVHVPIFFIMVVSNLSGLLTPLGDPPLFLGYLLGVPFFWTLTLFPFWVLAVGVLLGLFYVIEQFSFRKQLSQKNQELYVAGLALKGKRNLLCLAAITGAVFLPVPYREMFMILAAFISFWMTPKTYHRENNFSFYPIIEVAVLFFGLFVTMIPALELLGVHGAKLGLRTEWQFFWATGIFSSVLDNAPTYLTFVTVGKGLGLGGEILSLPEAILRAISVGAVFFGALTYIGNAPNFMVRAIAVKEGWNMPGFFGYIAKAGVILLPFFGFLTFFFFMNG